MKLIQCFLNNKLNAFIKIKRLSQDYVSYCIDYICIECCFSFLLVASCWCAKMELKKPTKLVLFLHSNSIFTKFQYGQFYAFFLHYFSENPLPDRKDIRAYCCDLLLWNDGEFVSERRNCWILLIGSYVLILSVRTYRQCFRFCSLLDIDSKCNADLMYDNREWCAVWCLEYERFYYDPGTCS